jgi:F-type H+-transporting ATPase subunit epsilon
MLDVVVVNPHRVLFEGQAHSVTVPGEKGVFEMLSYHKPLLSRLVGGDVVVDGQYIPIHRGICRVESNTVALIVEDSG